MVSLVRVNDIVTPAVLLANGNGIFERVSLELGSGSQVFGSVASLDQRADVGVFRVRFNDPVVHDVLLSRVALRLLHGGHVDSGHSLNSCSSVRPDVANSVESFRSSLVEFFSFVNSDLLLVLGKSQVFSVRLHSVSLKSSGLQFFSVRVLPGADGIHIGFLGLLQSLQSGWLRVFSNLHKFVFVHI